MVWFRRANLRVREWFHCRVGTLFLRRGNLAQAQRHFLKVIEDDYPSYVARYNLGKIFLRQDHIPRALEELRVACDIADRLQPELR